MDEGYHLGSWGRVLQRKSAAPLVSVQGTDGYIDLASIWERHGAVSVWVGGTCPYCGQERLHCLTLGQGQPQVARNYHHLPGEEVCDFPHLIAKVASV